MSKFCDEEALNLLLKSPKKKYLKKLIELGIITNLNHERFPSAFMTPISENFQSDLGLTFDGANRLLIALAQFIDIAYKIKFQFDKFQIFSADFDEQLKQLLFSTALGLAETIKESKGNMIGQGNKLIDINWKLDIQIANDKGKSNIPNILMELQSVKRESAELQSHKITIEGEKFQAFFGNLKKIKDQLNQLVADS